MALLVNTLLCIIVYVPLLYSKPVEHPGNIEKRGATDEGCYGTKCYFDPDYYDKDIDVTFPENLTEAVISALPSIESSQGMIVALLNQSMLVSKEQHSELLKSITILSASITAGLQRQEEIAQLTSTMSSLLSKMVILLQNQHGVVETTTVTPVADQVVTTEPAEPMDCQEVFARGFHDSGSYEVTPPDNMGSFTAYCDMDMDGGGWTVVQKRFDGSVNFYKPWEDYAQGFGNTDGEHWMGLRNIRRLVSQEGTSWSLRIDMQSFDSESAYAMYNTFMIGDIGSNYMLSISGYSGNAGDSLLETQSELAVHNGMEFTTYDQDNDNDSSRNCALRYKGGWWYNNCFYSNLNGKYLGSSVRSWEGMLWRSWKGQQSLKSSEMKIKRHT